MHTEELQALLAEIRTHVRRVYTDVTKSDPSYLAECFLKLDREGVLLALDSFDVGCVSDAIDCHVSAREDEREDPQADRESIDDELRRLKVVEDVISTACDYQADRKLEAMQPQEPTSP